MRVDFLGTRGEKNRDPFLADVAGVFIMGTSGEVSEVLFLPMIGQMVSHHSTQWEVKLHDPPPFAYFAPTTLPEAFALWHKHGTEAKLLSGGQSLIPLMKLRLATPAVP